MAPVAVSEARSRTRPRDDRALLTAAAVAFAWLA